MISAEQTDHSCFSEENFIYDSVTKLNANLDLSMPKLTYQFITIIAITLLCFPVLAKDVEDPAKKLVQEL